MGEYPSYGSEASPIEDRPELMKKDRYIEDDFKILRDIDARIAELIAQRHERMDTINAQHRANSERIIEHTDWFEGSVRCNPVPDRSVVEAPMEYEGKSQGIESVRRF